MPLMQQRPNPRECLEWSLSQNCSYHLTFSMPTIRADHTCDVWLIYAFVFVNRLWIQRWNPGTKPDSPLNATMVLMERCSRSPSNGRVSLTAIPWSHNRECFLVAFSRIMPRLSDHASDFLSPLKSKSATNLA
jgi:hypothetical protein